MLQQDRLEKLVGHRWMEKQFSEFVGIEFIEEPTAYLKEFKEGVSSKAYKDFDANEDIVRLEELLENEIIDFYYKKSLNTVNPETFELKYINKN